MRERKRKRSSRLTTSVCRVGFFFASKGARVSFSLFFSPIGFSCGALRMDGSYTWSSIKVEGFFVTKPSGDDDADDEDILSVAFDCAFRR